MTVSTFRLAFVAFVLLAAFCAVGVSAIGFDFASKAGRGRSGVHKGSGLRGVTEEPREARAPKALSQPVNTAPHTAGKPAAMAGASGPVRSPFPSIHFGRDWGAGMVSAQGDLYEVTAYSHGCILPRFGPEGPARRAANGRWPIADVTVAADTSLHAFGSELIVEGLGFRIVGDRGHAIKGRRLDIFMDTCREARKFGRRWLSVYPVPPETSMESAQ